MSACLKPAGSKLKKPGLLSIPETSALPGFFRPDVGQARCEGKSVADKSIAGPGEVSCGLRPVLPYGFHLSLMVMAAMGVVGDVKNGVKGGKAWQ